MGRKPRQESTSARPAHVTLAVVLQVREGRLQVAALAAGARAVPRRLVRSRAATSSRARRWSSRSGATSPQKVDVRELAHLEQLETLSDPTATRSSGSSRPPTSASSRPTSTRSSPRTRAGTRSRACPSSPSTTARSCSPAASGCGRSSRTRTSRFALAPPVFTISELRELYVAALGHEVSATNLQRVLLRRGVLEPTGERREPGRTRRPPGRALPLPLAAARDHRPVRGAAPARALAVDAGRSALASRERRRAIEPELRPEQPRSVTKMPSRANAILRVPAITTFPAGGSCSGTTAVGPAPNSLTEKLP